MRQRPLTICAVGSSKSAHVAARVRCFAELGHRVFLITEARTGIEGVTELVPSADLGGSRVISALNRLSLRLRGRPIQRLSLLGLLMSFPRLVKQCHPDVVHVHYAYSGWAWMATVVARHPLVVSVMGGDVLFDEQGSPTPRGRWLTLQLLREADLITSKSDFLIGVLDRLGGFGDKAIRVVWGVDLNRFRRTDSHELRARLGLTPDDIVILSPKILRPFYNVHLLVEAMPRIAAAIPRAVLLVTEYLADAEYKYELHRRVQALGLERCVRFVGHVAHADMPQYYSAAAVAVAVPSSDGLPQTLLEAMACEVPNVLSRLPRYEEVVTHEESAYFVDLSSPAIADGTVRVLGNSALRERMIHSGRALVERMADFDKEVRRVEAHYYALLSRRPPARAGYITRTRVLLEIVRYWIKG
jgi:glycosyltransferase involved in cell wall biosynthesis